MKWIEENTKMFFFVIMVIGGIIGVMIANYMDDGDWIVGLFVGAFAPLIIVMLVAGVLIDISWPSPRNRG